MWIVTTALVIAISISIDALAASFAYGCKKIKMPLHSLVIIALICTAVMGFSFAIGAVLLQYIPERGAAWLSFAILFSIGIVKFFDSITKSIIRHYTKFRKELNLSVLNFKLVLHIYADPEAADVDISKSISPKEATVLATSLSLDGFAVGIGAAIIGTNGWLLVLFTLVMSFFALLFGCWLGNKAADRLQFNISWLGGVILIVLAFLQL